MVLITIDILLFNWKQSCKQSVYEILASVITSMANIHANFNVIMILISKIGSENIYENKLLKIFAWILSSRLFLNKGIICYIADPI